MDAGAVIHPIHVPQAALERILLIRSSQLSTLTNARQFNTLNLQKTHLPSAHGPRRAGHEPSSRTAAGPCRGERNEHLQD